MIRAACVGSGEIHGLVASLTRVVMFSPGIGQGSLESLKKQDISGVY